MTIENKAPRGRKDTDWQCECCKRWYPVAIMARDCEKKHDDYK